jgi:hypothetical protein
MRIGIGIPMSHRKIQPNFPLWGGGGITQNEIYDYLTVAGHALVVARMSPPEANRTNWTVARLADPEPSAHKPVSRHFQRDRTVAEGKLTSSPDRRSSCS